MIFPFWRSGQQSRGQSFQSVVSKLKYDLNGAGGGGRGEAGARFHSQIHLGNAGRALLGFTEGCLRTLPLPLCFMNPQNKAAAFPKFWAILCEETCPGSNVSQKSILRN